MAAARAEAAWLEGDPAPARAVVEAALDLVDRTADLILVSRDAESEDGSIVTGNRVSKVRADSGGTGQNGNGINLDKANGVIVADNVLSHEDTLGAYSAARQADRTLESVTVPLDRGLELSVVLRMS